MQIAECNKQSSNERMHRRGERRIEPSQPCREHPHVQVVIPVQLQVNRMRSQPGVIDLQNDLSQLTEAFVLDTPRRAISDDRHCKNVALRNVQADDC